MVFLVYYTYKYFAPPGAAVTCLIEFLRRRCWVYAARSAPEERYLCRTASPHDLFHSPDGAFIAPEERHICRTTPPQPVPSPVRGGIGFLHAHTTHDSAPNGAREWLRGVLYLQIFHPRRGCGHLFD